MLHTIPFHATLLRRDLGNNIKSTNAHVLLYGAIEVHDAGEKGCIASNDKLGRETGYAKGTVENRLSEMAAAGWVTVVMKDGKRIKIIPNGNITFDNASEGGFPHTGRGVPVHGNIDNSLDNNSTTYSVGKPTTASKNNSKSPLLFGGPDEKPKASSGKKEEGAAPPADPPTTRKLFYDVVKKYKLIITNHAHVKKWCDDLDSALSERFEGVPLSQIYLNRLLERDLIAEQKTEDFVPTLNTPFDIVSKAAKIIQYFTRTKDKYTNPDTEARNDDYYRQVEAEAKKIREAGGQNNAN